ncbi:MAG: mechanosensitive ion channel [Bacteroidales bacterium]|nr:mechanosensitive ion channel [Bacteroidales bacterium]
MSSLRVLITQYLAQYLGEASSIQLWITFLLLIAVLFVVSGFISFALKNFFAPFLRTITSKTASQFDDILLSPQVLKAVSWVVPGIIFSAHLGDCYTDTVPQWLRSMLEHGVDIYNVVAFSLLIAKLITAINEMMKQSNRYGDYHLDGIFQAVRLIVYIVMAIIIIAIVIGQKPGAVLTGIGASAAILMLVFKDTIMGFVASIQLTSNKMIKRDDWVAIERLGINGKVEEVNLTTVKIRNWDNSVSTVPPYTLVSDSFQNWTEMKEKGARLMKRTILIDLNTVERDASTGEVNLTRFREHVWKLIEKHPRLYPDAIYVRLLSATGQGLPIEISFYLSETDAVPFEQLVSAFMEEVFADLPQFGLKVFQKTVEKQL